MKLSNNLWLSEVIKSNTAVRRGIDNNPTELHISNLTYIAEKIFQPIREHFGSAIHVSSGYRSKGLNEAIGGSKISFHSHGMALDLDMDGRSNKITNADIFNYIKENLPYSELIWEFGTDENPNWVHVAIAKGREDEKVTKIAYKHNYSKTQYKAWDKKLK